MMRRPALLALLLPLFVAAACDGDGPTGTAEDLAGTYDLISFAGQALPYMENFGPCENEETLQPIPGSSDLGELESVVLVLSPGGGFVMTWTSREACRAANGSMIRDWTSVVDVNEGTFTRAGSRVTLTADEVFELEGTVSGARINIENFLLFERR